MWPVPFCGAWGLEQDSSRLRFYDERIVMADISKVQKLTGCLADLGRMSQLRSTAVLTLLHRAQLGTVCLTWPIHNSESSQLRSRTSVGIQYVIHLQYSNDEKWRCALIAMCCSEDGFHSQTSRCSFECSWIIGAMRRPSVILWPGKNQPLEDARAIWIFDFVYLFADSGRCLKVSYQVLCLTIFTFSIVWHE